MEKPLTALADIFSAPSTDWPLQRGSRFKVRCAGVAVPAIVPGGRVKKRWRRALLRTAESLVETR
jgi:hypothetical protein